MKKLMELAQAQQVKELEASFEKENKEMKAAQAKVCILLMSNIVICRSRVSVMHF